MSIPFDRYSHLAALRSAKGGPGQNDNLPERQAHLRHLLGAELRVNPLGRHVAVSKRFAEPHKKRIGSQALRLLLPETDADSSDPRSWIFLDTETTGLAGGTGTYAFLVGLAWWEEDGLAVEQFFMQDFAEEPSLLAALADRLTGRAVLVTYNGKSFDWPLLETRYRMTRTAKPTVPPTHLDLLHPARQIWRHSLNSLALTEVERQVLGLERRSDIPSSVIPSLYFDFLRGGPVEPLAAVFHHNQMDLRGLALLAERIARMLEDPDGTGCGGAELYGISRILHRRGESHLAGITCECALMRGLPEEVGRSARRQLALMARRKGDFGRANEHWEQLLNDPQTGLLACEQLAIHFEHRGHDLERAAGLVRKALAKLHESLQRGIVNRQAYFSWHSRFSHRLDRLTRKLGNA